MKSSIQISLLSTLLLSGSTFALTPVQGFYGGLFGDIAIGLGKTPVSFNNGGMNFSGQINNTSVGGGGAVNIGYRIQNFRVEGELLFNIVNTDNAAGVNCSVNGTPPSACPAGFQSNLSGFSANTTSIYAFLNGMYDFINIGKDNDAVFYLGLGAGGANLNQSVNLNNNIPASLGFRNVIKAPAGQIILGVSDYLDDFTWIGMDYRFIGVIPSKSISSKPFLINTINFNINFSFNL